MADTLTLHRLTVDYRDGRIFRDHFTSETEAELMERSASISGATTILHTIQVPLEPKALANWLNDYCREWVSA